MELVDYTLLLLPFLFIAVMYLYKQRRSYDGKRKLVDEENILIGVALGRYCLSCFFRDPLLSLTLQKYPGYNLYQYTTSRK